MATKKIELLKPFGLHVRGAVIEPDAPVADLLIARGAAKIVEPHAIASGVPLNEPEGATSTRRQAKLQTHGR